jgi:MFS family permease
VVRVRRLRVRFAAGLPMADIKAELVLTRLGKLGKVIEVVPPQSEFSSRAELRRVDLVLRTAADGAAIMIAADVMLMVVFSRGLGGSGLVFGFAGVLLFIIGFTMGFGTLGWVYASESFPSRLRSLGSSAMLTSSLLGNTIVAASFLTMLHSLGGAGTFAMFTVVAVVAFGFVYRYAPETKGRQLEDIRHFWENGGRWEKR